MPRRKKPKRPAIPREVQAEVDEIIKRFVEENPPASADDLERQLARIFAEVHETMMEEFRARLAQE